MLSKLCQGVKLTQLEQRLTCVQTFDWCLKTIWKIKSCSTRADRFLTMLRLCCLTQKSTNIPSQLKKSTHTHNLTPTQLLGSGVVFLGWGVFLDSVVISLGCVFLSRDRKTGYTKTGCMRGSWWCSWCSKKKLNMLSKTSPGLKLTQLEQMLMFTTVWLIV